MTVTILIAYVKGTERLMKACLESIKRYNAGAKYRIVVITEDSTLDEAKKVCGSDVDEILSYLVDNNAVGSERHAFLLDSYMGSAEGLVLTMDSDCLPIADNWLGELLSLHKPECNLLLPGIRWPWKPPSGDIEGIEGRVRKNQNWDRTWVACQLVDAGWVRTFKLKYNDGDDTGFALAEKAEEDGMQMLGWLPTRCALPEGDLDPELNRMVCVVYGDKIVHIGGGSGKAAGRVVDVDGMYDRVIDRILEEQGAEWILEDSENHKYIFDMEDEVVEYKMAKMYNEMRRYLLTHNSLFGS